VRFELASERNAAEMLEILPGDWNLKSIFTQKWASVDMNWGGSTPRQFQPWAQDAL